MDISNEYAVQMRGIEKSFGTYKVLDDINIDVKKGTVHAILGENGAGKSTLMNILYGMYHADAGEIYLNGEAVNIKNPSMAIKHGIGMVHQHFMLVDKFTVTQNIILGNETANAFGIINMKKARKDVIKIVEKYGLKVDPDARIEDISVGMQQRVEILKALYRGVDLLILDEPTAVLTPMEIEELIDIMRNLINDGKTIIIITHKLKEIKASSDDCTVIRKGKVIDRVKVKDESKQSLAEKMVGRKVRLVVEKTPANPGGKIFEINDLRVKCARGIETVKGLSLSIRKGEIFGIAGIEGNGQKELVEAITGVRQVESGTIKINGKEIQNTGTRNVIDNKISVIHEDRHRYGVVLDFSVADNAILENYRKAPFCKNGFLDYNARDRFTEELIKEYNIKPERCKGTRIRRLSGGNQQKLVVGREVANNPDLLIAVQPTRGLDVGAIEFVHKTLVRLRDEGKAILLISLELDEVMDVSDTISVIYDGSITGIFNQKEADEQKIGLLMAGGKENDENA